RSGIFSTRKQGFTSLSSSVCRIPVPSTIDRLQTISEGTAIVKAHGRATGVSATTSGRSSPSPLPRWRKDLAAGGCCAFAPAYWSDTVPLRVLRVEAHKKGNSDGHPSLCCDRDRISATRRQPSPRAVWPATDGARPQHGGTALLLPHVRRVSVAPAVCPRAPGGR